MKQTATTRSKFIARWSERGYEKGETQQFWIELLTDVLGIANASSWLTFEQHVPNIGFIDARIPRTKVLIEQKSALLDLFRVLNTPLALRDAYLEPELAAFPYVNGGLFREETPIPPFTPRLRQLILKNAALDFNWAEISPTIFGSLFESTLNPETRRAVLALYGLSENATEEQIVSELFRCYNELVANA